MTALTPLIEADFDFEFSPASTNDANKGGAHAGVSRAGCTVNEPYRLNEYLSKTSPRHNQTCQSGTLQENDAPYRLQPYQRVHKRDPENLDPYGPQNHPLPPFVPREERTVKGMGQ